MWNDIDERAVEIAEYAIATGKTVRAIAEKFGVSKSTVHIVVTFPNGLYGRLNKLRA